MRPLKTRLKTILHSSSRRTHLALFVGLAAITLVWIGLQLNGNPWLVSHQAHAMDRVRRGDHGHAGCHDLEQPAPEAELAAERDSLRCFIADASHGLRTPIEVTRDGDGYGRSRLAP